MNGCIGNGCTKGEGICTCTASCDPFKNPPRCEEPTNATCDPYNGKQEICFDGEDNNCNGLVDENCVKPEKSDDCGNTAGSDPLLLASRSAVTEPFTDFTVDTGLAQLAVTRTYASNDWSYFGGPHGIFGRGWHHQWEGWLSCRSGACTVTLGTKAIYQFMKSGTAPSLDGTEELEVYSPWSNEVLAGDHHNILVRRPGGEWIVFLGDGRELHFDSACDACSDPASDIYCQDASSGGKARLVKMIDAKGSSVQLRYDRPSGLLLGLGDDLGHSLEIVSTSACGSGLASALRYDGLTVATYGYVGSDLVQATDADGATLRGYAYDMAVTGRLLAVKNQAGDSVAEFAYDTDGSAIGVIDRNSSVSASYGWNGAYVTEFYGDTSSGGSRDLDRDGHVTSISEGNACGSARELTWTNRRLTRIADEMGHVIGQEYDALGRLTHRTEPSGQEEWRDYGIVRPIAQGVDLDLDQVIAISRKSSVNVGTKYVAESLSYDPAPQSIDPPGYTCQQSLLPTGSAVCRYITGGYVPSSSGPVLERHATFLSYDVHGRLIRSVGPVNLDFPNPNDVMPLEERTYWPDTETLARRGRLMQVKRYPVPNVAPLVTNYDYDAFGPFQIRNPNGGMTTIVKDGRGRPIVILGPDGQVSQTRYYDGLDPRLRLLPSGTAIRSGYDNMGRLARAEYLSADPEAPGVTPILGWGDYYNYDPAGNRVHAERRDAEGRVTWRQDRQYDVQHRIVADTNPASPATAKAWAYDLSGFLKTVTDEEGRATQYTPDAANRVAQVARSGFDGNGIPAQLTVASYVYDANADTLAAVNDANGAQTSYEHDDLGRLSVLDSNNLKGGQIRFSYDARGNPVQRKDGYVTLSYTYDGLDRVLTTSADNSADGTSIAYTYVYDEPGGEGRLTTIIEPDRAVRYGYDPAGRLTSEAVEEVGVSAPLVTQYSYDADGAMWEIIYPSGLHLELVRDPATRKITGVKNVDGGTPFADRVVHLPGGPVESLDFGNGSELTQAFNLRYEPQAIASGPLAMSYGMTPAGDVGWVGDGAVTQSFSYDFLDRIVRLAYDYGDNPTPTSVTIDGGPGTYSYLSGSRVAAMQDPQGLSRFAYAYDYQANLSAIGAYGSGGTAVVKAVCFRHDALGRMVLVGRTAPSSVTPDGTVCTNDGDVVQAMARFRYDAQGRRIARQDAASGQWTYIVSDQSGNPLSELMMTGDPVNPWVPVRDYIWLEGKPLAQVEYVNGTQYVYYYHLDQIGLPRALTNQNGQVVWSATARPYGDITETTTIDPLSGRTVVTNLRLPGQYDERLLSSLGLQGPYYNWYRWYLPGLGRYLELEPLLQSPSFVVKMALDGFSMPTYAYANNNPIKYTDEDGRCLATYDCCMEKHPYDPEACGGNPGEITRKLIVCEERLLACNAKCVSGSGCFEEAKEWLCQLGCGLEAEACRRGIIFPN